MKRVAKALFLLLAVALFAAPITLSYGQGNGNGNGNGNNGNGQSENNGNGPSGNNGNADQDNGGPAARPGNEPPSVDPTEPPTPPQSSETDALEAVQSGSALPLGPLLTEVEAASPGQVIDTQLVTVQGSLLYAIKVLAPDGKVGIEYYDAKSGQRLKVR